MAPSAGLQARAASVAAAAQWGAPDPGSWNGATEATTGSNAVILDSCRAKVKRIFWHERQETAPYKVVARIGHFRHADGTIAESAIIKDLDA
jgi:hypothetical protein